LIRRAAAIVAVLGAIGCGKKGPPLPPLIRLPAPPADFSAERRGASVDLQFVVPSANTDNSRPANVSRVEVYAVTARDPFSDEQIVKQGAKVASVPVKAPVDPDKTIEEDEAPADMEPPEGIGLDQGAVARVSESLSNDALTPVKPKADRKAKAVAGEAANRPLLAPSAVPLTRTYLAVGISTADKKGPPSKRLAVPLVPPPPPPAHVAVDYDEKAVSVKWDPVPVAGGLQRPAAADELPSRPLGAAPVAITYSVYDAGAKPAPVRLTPAPIADAVFSDPRIVWGEERCYTVRSVAVLGDLRVESDAPPPACAVLTDRFAPAPPANLQSSPTEGAVSLIWDANTEKDLAGYIVLRGSSPAQLEPITPAPIQETTFRDQVAAGVRFTYAVKAVDRAGNSSPASKTVEEAAR
jgi:hypothetical protein